MQNIKGSNIQGLSTEKQSKQGEGAGPSHKGLDGPKVFTHVSLL